MDTLSPLLRNNFDKGIQTFLKTRGKGGGGMCDCFLAQNG